MNQRKHDLLFAACGIAFVVLDLLGAIIATAGGKTHNLTISSTQTDIAQAVAKPAGTAVWIGAYLEFLSVGAFIAFAVWACVKLGGGLLGGIARAAATGYATATIASLAIMAAIAYRAGHGIGVPLTKTIVTVNEALYVSTWFLTAFFLVAAGALALGAGRRALGWSCDHNRRADANRHGGLGRDRRSVHRDALVRMGRLREHRDRPRQARTRSHRRGRAERLASSSSASGSGICRIRLQRCSPPSETSRRRLRPRLRLRKATVQSKERDRAEMGSSSSDVRVSAVVERARGVLAERFGIEIERADAILTDVARVQKRSITDLAAAVVESCTNGSTPLPRRLYTDSNGISDAA